MEAPLNPRELYGFLSRLSMQMQERGETELAHELQLAMKYFIVPLTSEFYGVSMVALRKVLSGESKIMSDNDKERASFFVKEIKEKWFSR